MRKYFADGREAPYKRRARAVTNAAIRSGELVRQTACQDCGWESGRIHVHHKDYAKPLDVEWLCAICHSRRHREPV